MGWFKIRNRKYSQLEWAAGFVFNEDRAWSRPQLRRVGQITHLTLRPKQLSVLFDIDALDQDRATLEGAALYPSSPLRELQLYQRSSRNLDNLFLICEERNHRTEETVSSHESQGLKQPMGRRSNVQLLWVALKRPWLSCHFVSQCRSLSMLRHYSLETTVCAFSMQERVVEYLV